MANSKYAYVRDHESKDTLESGCFIVLRVHCSNFKRFTKVHGFEKPFDERAAKLMNSCAMAVFEEFKEIVYGYGQSDEYSFVLEKNTQLFERRDRFSEFNEFEKPNDLKALNLMNSCASSMCKDFPDIILAYGFGHEYNFIFRKETDVYTRRTSKLVSVIVSSFTSLYRIKWIEFFPNKDMRSGALFEGEVLCLKETSDIQAYLAFKQQECDEKNLTNTCFWKLVESGKSEQEAHEILEELEKGKERLGKNEILFQQFGINYNDLPDMFRQGSCVLKTIVNDRRKVITVHTEDIASATFLNCYSIVSKELTDLEENASRIGEKHLNLCWVEKKMEQDHWIVVRIDGCRFSRFTKVHGFEKPFDERAAKLMNSCAMAVFEEFKEIVYGYGQSDEYSFVLEKNTQLFERRDSKLVSAICSSFTDAYVKKWKECFPKKDLQYAPRFDGRAVCYESYKLIRDYLAWRQVDCHMNTRFNTCFYARIHSGESTKTAQRNLQGTLTKERYKMLSQEFGIEYNQLPLMFRNGSSIFWDDKVKGDKWSEETSGGIPKYNSRWLLGRTPTNT
ncbi:tRNAHis guanylyltransferase [Artemisia annua]|uniref:tRNA(His) guanylyltransferase n=1 Tax=Artemisia annua TaxID=35608 RepID=A0A2U1Q8Z6_ARTAN|nr:tRNAHis guanylyltransferase [Artemisia annua]